MKSRNVLYAFVLCAVGCTCPPPDGSDKSSSDLFSQLSEDIRKGNNDVTLIREKIKSRDYASVADAGLRLLTMLKALYCSVSHDKALREDKSKEVAEILKRRWSETLPGKAIADIKPFLTVDEVQIVDSSKRKDEIYGYLKDFGLMKAQ